jgi:cytidylate kinase
MRSDRRPHHPVVTIAALYGAGESVVGPGVAERLGVPLLDRRISEEVARKAGVSQDAVAQVDEQPQTWRRRLLSSLGRLSTVAGSGGGVAERLDLQERGLRGNIEQFLAESRAAGGVTIGRGGMVVLRGLPRALHVHLGGPREARVKQAMQLEGVDHEAAARRQDTEDETRIGYVRRAYGVDGEDPSFYHLMLDSTALDLDACVELIVAASRARTRNHPRGA